MKAFGFWVLFMAVGTALVFLTLLNQNRLPQRKAAIVQSSAPRR